MKSKAYIWVKKYLGGLVRFLFRISSYGSENEPCAEDGPYIVISNHISNLDPIFICSVMKHQQPHFMAKKELFKIPLLSSLITALGAYPVDRGGADVGAIRKTIRMLEEGKSIGIFPQGHRQRGLDPNATEVKNGIAMIAARSEKQVLPCFIRTKKRKFTPFCKVEVIVGKPVKFSELNYNPDALGEYSRISKLLFERVCELEDSCRGE